ncbi:hypothetical protein [Carbonactinospora thermoautotrophica]|uniref:hypothetical protein n=1 Tax=Carbonactinospora thermoautotrophica TaxID=1469144 RepID=UPI0018D43193|nr:hypothetical protein [Carbonactinospora thermoautotrophica]
MIFSVIIACEIGFWIVLLAGLCARYLLRRRRLGAALLCCVPLVDLVLLVATVLHLRGGATAGWEHGLAAVYLGVSVAYGHQMVRWADERFAHRFAGGPPPTRPPKFGPGHARHQRQQWLRHLLAWATGCGLLLAAMAYVGDRDRTTALEGWIHRWTLVLAIDFLWSFSYTIWPRKPEAEPPAYHAFSRAARAARRRAGRPPSPARPPR